MKKQIEYFGGLFPWGRHAVRVVANRIWSRILRRRLGNVGPAFNIDFTARILGGKHVSIGRDFYAGRGLKLVVTNPAGSAALVNIGDHVGVNEYVTITAHQGLSIGDHVLIGSRVYVGNISHGRYKGPEQSDPFMPPNDRPFFGSGETVIEARVWLGEGVIIPGGVTIGRGSIIGAGSVVTKDVPPNVIAVGNPARVVKAFDSVTGKWIPVSADTYASLPPTLPPTSNTTR